jgi:hypothetical protein
LPAILSTLLLREVVTVVAKFGSSHRAFASSFSVSSVQGAVSTRLDIAVDIFVSTALEVS